MKNSTYRSFSLLFFVGFFLWACNDLKNLDPAKDLKLILNYKPADAFVEALVKDAKTGALITDRIVIDIVGKASANVINFEGETKSTYTKKGPSIYLGLRNIVPTEKAPLDFKVIVSAEGYLTTSREVTLRYSSNAPIEILMVKATTPPAGAAIQQTTVNASPTTGVAEDRAIEVLNGQNATLVELDKGTVLKDSKGNVLSGALQTTVATFSGSTKESAKAFPGGNTTVLAKGPNGETNLNATLVPITFAAIEMQAGNGSKVASFSKPVDISFEVDPKLIHPTTKKAIKEGDALSVYSYGEATGVWTYEKEGVIVKKGNEYFLTFATDHLSWYSIVQYLYSNTAFPSATLINTINFGVNLTIEDALPKPLNTGTYMWDAYQCEIEVYMKPFIEGGDTYVIHPPLGHFVGFDGVTSWMPLLGVPTNAEKIVLKINIGGEKPQVVEIKNISAIKENDIYKISLKRGNFKQKTIFVDVTCENDCPLEIKPYNVGIEYWWPLMMPATPNLYDNYWSFLGFVNYDNSDNKVKLIAYLPDNADMKFRATAFPEDIISLNTGVSTALTAPIVLKKDHPLCQCGK
jgi:hypothetical protein